MNRCFMSAGISLSALATAVFSTPAKAQSSGVLIGQVVDAQTGAAVAQALVIVTGTSLQGEQSVTTDKAGFFSPASLADGHLQCASLQWPLPPDELASVALRTGQTLRIAPRLQRMSQSSEHVVVDAPILDITSTSVGTSLQADFLTRVPIAAPSGNGGLQRSFEQVAVAAPGAQADAAGVSVAGATSPENTYRIDGMSVGSPRVGTLSSGFSVEFMQEVAVVDGGYMPEYGRTAGGTITATTKSGSNTAHGGAWMTLSPGSLQGPATIGDPTRQQLGCALPLGLPC